MRVSSEICQAPAPSSRMPLFSSLTPRAGPLWLRKGKRPVPENPRPEGMYACATSIIGSRRSVLSLAEFAKAHVSVMTSPATSPLSSSSASHSPQRDWVLSGGITTWSPEVGLIPIVSLLNHPAVTLSHECSQKSVFFFRTQIVTRGRELAKPRIDLF